jgi:hypothetical protein
MLAFSGRSQPESQTGILWVPSTVKAPHQLTFLKENKGWGGIPLKPRGFRSRSRHLSLMRDQGHYSTYHISQLDQLTISGNLNLLRQPFLREPIG